MHCLKGDSKAKTGPEALTKLYEALKEKLPEMELYEADELLAVSPNKVKKEDGVATHENYVGAGGGPLFQYGYKANGFQDVFDAAAGISGAQKGGRSPASPIPKVIHQIWLGKNPEPTEWTDTVEKFAKDHGWRYKLWRDADMKKIDFSAVEGVPEVYRSFGSELAGRADIVRYMILYQEGGVYIDADSVVMKPAKFAKFLEANRKPVFFAWENLSKARTRKLNIGGRRRLISNGTIGAVPHHPFFKAMLEKSVKNLKALKGKPLEAWRAVGPYMIVQLYERLKGDTAKDVHMYPMRFFYPRHWKGITDPQLHKKVKIPGQSMLFQYGYSTNGFAKIFKEREAQRRTRRRQKT
jgi:ribosomal protein L24E